MEDDSLSVLIKLILVIGTIIYKAVLNQQTSEV